jgi:hypothetical protein
MRQKAMINEIYGHFWEFKDISLNIKITNEDNWNMKIQLPPLWTMRQRIDPNVSRDRGGGWAYTKDQVLELLLFSQ